MRIQDISLLCDLFYLPFEHGSQGVQLLQEFNWLKSNAHVVTNKHSHNQQKKPEVNDSSNLYDGIVQFRFDG